MTHDSVVRPAIRRPGGVALLLDRINTALTMLAAVLTMIFFLLVFAQVVCRYLLSYSISWSEEVSRYAFVWATFVGAAAVAGRGEHYEVTILDGVVAEPVRVALVVLRRLIEGGFAFIVLYWGATWVARQWNVSTPVTEANQGLVYIVVPAFGAWLLIQALRAAFPAAARRDAEGAS